jgi:putative methanogenesis marker protein 7
MALVPVTYKGGIHQHDIVIALIEDLGGYIIQKHMVAQEVVLQAFVPREDIGLIARISKPLFGEITESPLVGMSLEIHHLPHPSCDFAEYCRRIGAKTNVVSPARGPGKRIAAINDEERDVINEHDIAVYAFGNFETCIEHKWPLMRRGVEVPIIVMGGPSEEALRRILNPPADGYIGNNGRFMRRTKEADELAKLDEMVAEVVRVLEKKRERIAKDPLSVQPARLMEVIREQVPAIHEVTSPTPLTVQMEGLRVKLSYDLYADVLRKLEIESGVTLGDIAEVVPSRMRDYIIVRILPFSETNTVV